MAPQGLVIYEEDAQDLAERLDAFLSASRATLVILIDRGGQIIAKRGYVGDQPGEQLAALSAAAFAATEEVARLIGEESFTVLFHEGEHRNVHISIVGDSALLLTAFDDRTTLGLVRLYAAEAADNLKPVLDRIQHRSARGDLPDAARQPLFSDQPASPSADAAS